jgi:hypothetical protein
MTRIILAGIVGAVIYFVWGMAAWMVLPLHGPSLAGLPDQNAIRAAFQSQDLQTGVYVIPWSDNADDWQQPESEVNQMHRAGPLATIFYQQAGSELMPPRILVVGFFIDLLAAMLAACLLSATLVNCPSYAQRVGFVLGLGIFVALIGHVSYWNWMRFPTDYTIAFMIDVIVGWTLAGLAIAAIVRPEPNLQDRVAVARQPQLEQQPPAKQPAAPVAPVAPTRNDAITLLATLQREARLVDIVKEPLTGYSDAQVGAAVRDVLRECGTVLDRLFDLQAVVDQAEGDTVEIPAGFDAGRYRITGDVARQAPVSASLVHHGWQANRCNLPQWTGSKDTAMIVAPAEVEVK